MAAITASVTCSSGEATSSTTAIRETRPPGGYHPGSNSAREAGNAMSDSSAGSLRFVSAN
jgi:hypothetical protein